MQERRRYGGRPLGNIYWSIHKPGCRKQVKHVQKGGIAYFSYINGADEVNGDGGGESLTHQLFKEAIAGLSGTKLKLGSFGEHEITITAGETEKKILTSDGFYYADVYWRINSTSGLELKWSGEVYLEVNHAHAVPPYKQESLRQARLPVIEVDIPHFFEYSFEDQDSTDLREAAHIRKIQGVLENGFLAGRVISDRSSVEYLEHEICQLEQKLKNATQDLLEERRRVDVVMLQLKTASERELKFKRIIGDLTKKAQSDVVVINDLGGKLGAEMERSKSLSNSLSVARIVIENRQRKIYLIYWMLGGLFAFVVIFLVFLLYKNFTIPIKDESVQVVRPSMTDQTAPTVTKKAKTVQPRRAPKRPGSDQ